jgi:hypothetical protein
MRCLSQFHDFAAPLFLLSVVLLSLLITKYLDSTAENLFGTL